ncbi:LysR family transcriptional regulator [Pelistega sp. NLN82]|uniref:LysR family transcriptional regulator n=1 Tax=Pelistega ratti TaxID=2652177 RepID=A0A6L9Y5G8_9BURK|nr:LysR substrate-binding domain-containing protein [Pelistega ratti]NEN75157.1 LysR family transcriptional regulator [Pelistega ratti]
MNTLSLKDLDLNDLYLFVHVVEARNFSEAARKLNIPKATVSRRIMRLEKQLGVALVQRNTRQFEITHIGQQFYSYCLDFVSKAEEIEHFIRNQNHFSGKVKFSCPREMLDTHITPILVTFMQTYPSIQIHIENTNQPLNLIQEQIDFAIRGRPLPLKDSTLISRPLFTTRHYLVASSRLTTKPVEHLTELLNFPSLSWSSQKPQWEIHHKHTGQRIFLDHQPVSYCDNFFFLQKAVLSSIGIASLPEALVLPHLISGEMVALLPEEWELPSWLIHAAYTSRKLSYPAKLLLDFLAERLNNYP